MFRIGNVTRGVEELKFAAPPFTTERTANNPMNGQGGQKAKTREHP